MKSHDVLSLFIELAAIPSPPGEEREVADRVIAYMRDLGLEVDEDGAGAAVGSTMGNLYCRLEPTNGPGGTQWLLAGAGSGNLLAAAPLSTTVTIRDAERLSITIQTPRAAQKFRAATPTAGLPSAAVA